MEKNSEISKKDPNGFIALARAYMERCEIESPNQLWRLLKDRGPRGTSPSRATVQGYFMPVKSSEKVRTPGRWCIRAMVEIFDLNELERLEFYDAYFKDYE